MVIAEHPDESLIVMRRKLCWDIFDILYLPLNVRKYPSKKKTLDKKLAEKLRNWNRVDWMLHKGFNETLWKQIKVYGQDFWDELEFYNRQKSRINQFCDLFILKDKSDEEKLKTVLKSPEYIVIPGSPWGKEYIIDPVWCLMNKMTTMGARNIIRVKSHPELCHHIERNSTRVRLSIFMKSSESEVTVMNPVFCSKGQVSSRSGFQIPREVLEHPEIYEIPR